MNLDTQIFLQQYHNNNTPLGATSLPFTEEGNLTLQECLKRYNKDLDTQDVQAWVYYKRKMGFDMKHWRKYFITTQKEVYKLVFAGKLFMVGTDEFVPLPIYTFCNVYEKIKKMNELKILIISKFSKSVFDKSITILKNAKPPLISLFEKEVNNRLYFQPYSDFAKNTKVEDFTKESGLFYEKPISIYDAFKDYLDEIDSDFFEKNTSPYEVKSYFLRNEVVRGYSKEEARETKRNVKKYGEKAFIKFLDEALTVEEKTKIDLTYNAIYNAYSKIDYKKIPIYIPHSKSFLGNKMQLRDVQIEALAFLELTKSGLIAYDVGLGKTLIAIAEVINAIVNDKAKRPLIVVPNPTYKNWLKEMFGDKQNKGLLSGLDITLNDWGNLSKVAKETPQLLENEVKENSVTVLTYEGFTSLGFTAEAQNSVFEVFVDDNGNIENESSDREKAKMKEVYENFVGKASFKSKADFDVLGFDYIIVDEAHNFKNVFSNVPTNDNEKRKRFGFTGSQSSRAVKMFVACNYVQKEMGGNIMLLTATPFTNSPLEIYSMMSFICYDFLKKNNIINVQSFFEKFVNEGYTDVLSVSGKLVSRPVVNGFYQLRLLKKMIFTHLLLKDGTRDVFPPIPRPKKLNLPRLDNKNKKREILTYLPQSDFQEIYQDEIIYKAEDKSKLSNVLEALLLSKKNALSPYFYDEEFDVPFDDFVEDSPKIYYTIKCIKTVIDYHKNKKTELSGQIIYANMGVQFFPKIKEYLEKHLHFKKGIKYERTKIDEVEIIASGISETKKENIKNAFNKGTVKIIIGSPSIKEGLNLQVRSSTLYNLTPDWNPTDFKQLEGRIFRQGNTYGAVRIVTPLVENSGDIFIFQKLQEKRFRLNSILSKEGEENYLPEEDLNPDEIKYALITNVDVLANYDYTKQLAEANKDFVIKQEAENKIKQAQEDTKNYNSKKQSLIDDLIKGGSKNININIDDKKLIIEAKKTKLGYFSISYFRGALKKKIYIDKYLKQKGITDISQATEEAKKDLVKAEKHLEYVKSDAFKDELRKIIKQKISKYGISNSNLNKRVKEFENTNILLDVKFENINDDITIDDLLAGKKAKKQAKTTKEIKLIEAIAIAMKMKLDLQKWEEQQQQAV